MIRRSKVATVRTWLVATFLGLVAFGVHRGQAAAAPFLPDQADFGGADVRLLVGNPSAGGQTGIDAPVSIVKIYSTNPTINLTIGGLNQCHGDGYDYLNPGATRFEVFGTNAAENRIGAPRAALNNSASCTNNTRTISVTHPGPRSGLLGHTQYYVFVFQARLLGGSFGWNTFNLSAPGTFIGYSDNSGERFAIKGRFVEGGSGVATYANYTLRFGVPCEITTPISRTLRWFDADQGQPNQARPMAFDVFDDTTGQYVIQNNTNLGGQNQQGTQTLTFLPGHSYRWIWRNVSSHNGIQMQIPFDSIYFQQVCSHGFSVTPNALTNLTPDSEAPANAVFTTGATFSGSPSRTTYTRSYYIRRGAAIIPINPPPAPSPEVRVNTGASFAYPADTRAIPGAQLGDQICTSITVSPAAGMADGTGNILSVSVPSRSAEDCEQIVHRPYSRVYGGDAQAGLGFSVGGTCGSNTSARFIGFNRGGNPYTGAGTQLAAFAVARIEEFATGQARDATTPKALTFANNGNAAANSPYGGGLGGGGVACADDFYAQVNGQMLGGAVAVDTLANGSYRAPDGVHITAAATLAHGSQRTIYVDGDAFISGGGITFAPGAYANQAQIPVFRLIVRGNIYVEPSVTQLDGIFIAQPNGGTGGRFYTCGSRTLWGSNAPANVPNSGQIIANCNQRLTVYGAVLADTIKFLRSRGTRARSVATETYAVDNNPATPDGDPAELFIFSPEVWLGGELQGSGGAFDYITALPPVL